jgi:HSP20 family molecular chaperone IbpA
MPPVDIEEDDREYLLKAELPGMKKEDFKLKVEGEHYRSLASERRKRKKRTKSTIVLNAATARLCVALRYQRLS